jgi:hypothetical protein
MTITRAGTISPTHELDFKMRAAVHSTIGALASLGSQSGIPFTITGTSEDPSFRPDVKGLAGEVKESCAGRECGVGFD